jgi:hypothetical protein
MKKLRIMNTKHPDQYIIDVKSIDILKERMSKVSEFKPPVTELYKWRKFRQVKINKNEY